MSEISDEIRKITKRYRDWLIKPCKELNDLADRIDAEMVELPRDKDGKLIRVGETVYDLDGYEHMAVSHRLCSEKDPRWMVSVGSGIVYPRNLTHERPDSFERIADELDEWKRKAAEKIPGFGLEEDALHALADRIRKLAKEREHE